MSRLTLAELISSEKKRGDKIKHYIPRESTGIPSTSGGTCMSCGNTYDATRLINRLPYLLTGTSFGRPTYGYKLCIYCSKHTCDDRILLYSYPMKDWTRRNKMNLA